MRISTEAAGLSRSQLARGCWGTSERTSKIGSMSEYQYYEFLAVDRGLTPAEMKKLRAISSRAEITKTRFANAYNWANLKADPDRLLERYFDIHVYVASWGSARVSFRLPRDSVSMGDVGAYRGESVRVRAVHDHVVIDLWSDSEDGGEWVEGDGWMACLAAVRTELLCGDYRALYLAWLLWMEEYLEPDETEPPVPPGLGELSTALQSLIDFLRIDPHLVAAAAEASEPAVSLQARLAGAIGRLRDDEKDSLLLRAVSGDHAAVGAELARQCRLESPRITDAPRRSAGELTARAESLRQAEERRLEQKASRERRRREAADAAAREKRLDALAPRQDAVWREVEELVSSKKPKRYDQAIELLVDLRYLAARDDDQARYLGRLGGLVERHARKRAFITRVDRAELPTTGMTFAEQQA